MTPGSRLRQLSGPGHRDRVVVWVGAVLALAVGALLFTRFSLDDTLRRDEAIYTYGGEQLVHGIPMYASIFDPKTPLAAMIAGIGAWWAQAFGGDQIHAIRIVFCVFAVAAVGGVYLVGLRLWRSALAALAGAVGFSAFRGFALDAIGGPDAKTPGIAFGLLAMALLVRRRWFWGAFAGGLAFLVWQPLITYVLVALAGAVVLSDRAGRLRAVGAAAAGAVLPIAAMVGYYAVAGALPKLIEAAITFPVTGVERPPETLGQRVGRIFTVAQLGYGPARWLLWGGLLLVLLLLVHRAVRARWGVLRDPYAVVVVGSLVPLVLFTLTDFQGYPDLYPLLPYAALGFAGGVAALVASLRGRALVVARSAVVAVLAAAFAGTWAWYSVAHDRDTGLDVQRANAATLARYLGPGDRLYALGDPTTLVLTGRRNPSRYIYLGSGVANWMLSHSPGGLRGWKARIRASDPAIVALGGWDGPLAVKMAAWLSRHHAVGGIGPWLVFVKPAVRDRAARRGLFLDAPLLKSWPRPGP